MKYKWLIFEKLEAEDKKKNEYLEGMKSDSSTASAKHMISMNLNVFLLAR